MLTSFLIMVAAQAAAATTPSIVPATVTEPDVPKMSPRDIKAFNMTVPASHPYHIRCVRQVDVGSLVAATNTCKTNQQWNKTDQMANDDARDVGDKMASKFTNSN